MGRALSPVVAALIAVSSVPALFGQTPDAAQVMASAREALGGEKKLSAVHSFVATGRGWMGRLGTHAVYASPGQSPARTQDTLPVVGQTLPGGLDDPLGSSERF